MAHVSLVSFKTNQAGLAEKGHNHMRRTSFTNLLSHQLLPWRRWLALGYQADWSGRVIRADQRISKAWLVVGGCQT